MHQVVDLRRGASNTPIRFGDDHTRTVWEAECHAQEEQMLLKGIRYSPTPRCPITLPGGRVIQPGQPLSAQDLAVPARPGERLTALDVVAAEPALRRLVSQGRIIEVQLPDAGPEAA
jgi:hypothetical protein